MPASGPDVQPQHSRAGDSARRRASASQTRRASVRRRPRFHGGVAMGAVTGMLLAGGLAFVLLRDDGPSCTGTETTLRVVASPDIAPVIEAVGASLSRDAASCVTVNVQPVESASMLATLADGRLRPPDVWVPDSRLWLTRAKDDRVVNVTNARPVAISPLVLTVSRATAATLRPGAARPEIADLVGATSAGRPFTVQLDSQRLSPRRVGAILALREATADRRDARAALTGLLRSARTTTTAGTTGTTGTAGAAILSRVAPSLAVPAPEQAVWAGYSDGQAADLVAIYPGHSTFDYPYAVLAASASTSRAADLLFDRLRSSAGQRAVQAAGFRNTDGLPDDSLTPRRGVDGTRAVLPSALDAASLALAERTLASVTLDARLLAVVDVSGSMAWALAGKTAVGPSRLSLAAQAAANGLALYPDSTQVGLWAFSRNVAGERDYRELVPVAGLGGPDGARARLAGAVRTLKPIKDGGSALYATTLAAVRAMQKDWTAGRVNAVVVLSDGADTDHGMSLAQLLATLRAERIAAKPVPVITIAWGPDSDAPSLSQISAVTGGAAYPARSPDQIRQVFLDAVGQRVCRPSCTPA